MSYSRFFKLSSAPAPVLLARGCAGILVLISALSAMAQAFLPAGPLTADITYLAALMIFTAAYVALAAGKVPGLRLDRAGIALAGAALMLCAGVIRPEMAAQAIDFPTLMLLTGIMIVVAALREAGIFRLAAVRAMSAVHSPSMLLAVIVGITGCLSAFLVNDAICIVLSPLVLDLTLKMKRDPVPYLLAVAMAANIGSVATITGNPQNIMIGSFSQLPYLHFAAALAPVAGIGLVLTYIFLRVGFRAEFATPLCCPVTEAPVRAHAPLQKLSVAALILLVTLFFAGVPPAVAALLAGALLLMFSGLKAKRLYAGIDGPLLLMFAGLFVLVAGAEHVLLTKPVLAAVAGLHLENVPVLSAVTAVLSNIVSNVPAVMVLRPFVAALADHNTAWLVVAMSSTLAGNFTILGSVANLIVVQKAAGRGVHISFWSYFRIGAPLSVLTIILGTVWLCL